MNRQYRDNVMKPENVKNGQLPKKKEWNLVKTKQKKQ